MLRRFCFSPNTVRSSLSSSLTSSSSAATTTHTALTSAMFMSYSMKSTVSVRRTTTPASAFFSGHRTSASFPLLTHARHSYCTAKQQQQQQQKASTEDKKEEGETKGSEKGADGKPEEEDMHWIKREYLGLRHDLKEFPDIYNGVNMFQMALFTIFCLSSTGSQNEADWWTRVFGVDGGALAPWSWLLHPLLTTNFLSMTFAMILVHNLGHSVVGTTGAAFLSRYLTAVTVISGVMMYALNAFVLPAANKVAAKYMKSDDPNAPPAPPLFAIEPQYGPWNVACALFVASHANQGYTPFALFNSFNGWVKYATWVGGVVILYYDWQPCLLGTLTAVALHRAGIMRVPNIVQGASYA
eukprot:PhM_4_TR13339/c1_g1_i1/m.17540